MESEASFRPPKQSKLSCSTRFSSTLIQDSIFNRVAILPAELINEILVKLPVKSLLKFRCVSKSWLDLISSPEFINTHLSKSANNKVFTHHRLMLSFNEPKYNLKDCSVSSLLYDSVSEALDLEYPRKKSDGIVEIMGSVNGLICLAISQMYFFIWNPSIKKFKKLPDCRNKWEIDHLLIYGFGFDEVNRDYKVVAGFQKGSYADSFRVNVKIYSLNSRSWTSIEDFETGKMGTRSGIFVNGKLFWAKDFLHTSRSDIISFDLADRTWGKVEQPYYGEEAFCWTLGVLGSDLSVLCNYYRKNADLWVLKEYGVKESWIKIFNINMSCDHMTDYHLCLFFCMPNKGEILIQLDSTFMIYNPRDHSIVHRRPHTRNDYEASIYIESLVWPFFQRKESRMQQRRRLK